MIDTKNEIQLDITISRVELNDTNIFLRIEDKHNYNIVFAAWVNEDKIPIAAIAQSLSVLLEKTITNFAKGRTQKH